MNNKNLIGFLLALSIILPIGSPANAKQRNPALREGYLESDGFYRKIVNITKQETRNDVYCVAAYGQHHFFDGTSGTCLSCSDTCRLLPKNVEICFAHCESFLGEVQTNKTLQKLKNQNQNLQKTSSDLILACAILFPLFFILFLAIGFDCYWHRKKYLPKYYEPRTPIHEAPSGDKEKEEELGSDNRQNRAFSDNVDEYESPSAVTSV